MFMDLSEILNFVLGGSLVGAVVSIVSIRSALKKARADAERALAEADTVKLTNTEQATRILVDNIVEPLKEELNETRRELGLLKREVARFRKAVDSANSCRYNADCPVLERMRNTPREHVGVKARSVNVKRHGQRGSPVVGVRQREGGGSDGSCEGSDVGCEYDDSDGQPP